MMSNNTTKPNYRLVLASSSTYRKEQLSKLQLPFETYHPNIDETPLHNETADETALRLAFLKASTIGQLISDAIIIGSDQVALLDNAQIGKPGNHENALEQLIKMQGKEVVFHTALCVFDGRENIKHPKTQLKNIQTKVKFRTLSTTELDHYLHIEQPYDCAGSAKNEGLGIALMEYIKSDDPSALTGLPLIELSSMLRNCNIPFFQMR